VQAQRFLLPPEGGEDGGGGVYANRRERGVLFKANKLKQDIKKYVAVYSAAAAYYIRLSLCKSFRTFVCCIRPLSSSAAATLCRRLAGPI